MLIPDGRNSLLSYDPADGDMWTRRGIPRGLGCRIVALRVAEGQLQLAEQRVAAADEEIIDLQFQSVAITELRETLGNMLLD